MTDHAFSIISGAEISRLIPDLRPDILRVVQETYLQHEDGLTNNPDSYFLRFEDQPQNRIIALPASIGGAQPIAGIKWIASYPNNIKRNMQRASAVLILNDCDTGYPTFCLEASQISAARTAASAVVATRALTRRVLTGAAIAVVGAGVIARSILDFFVADGWSFDRMSAFDISVDAADALSRHATSLGISGCSVRSTLEGCIRGADVVVFATNASVPYVEDEDLLSPGQIVLNISLRDIAPSIIWKSFNVFDDVNHCMKANTSAHLAEQRYGNRSFVHGTIGASIRGAIDVDRSRPIIVSPFGLGILDLAVARIVVARCRADESHVTIADFFPNIERWSGRP